MSARGRERRVEPGGAEPSRLTKPRTEAERVLSELIASGREIAKSTVAAGTERWADEVKTVLERYFTGPEATEFSSSILRASGHSASEWHEQRLWYLTSLQNRVKHYDEALPPVVPSVSTLARAPSIGRGVFVVHGHDDAAKHEVARTLERLGLEPVILHEQPDAGRLILEKFEALADVGYAVVLLTPDDSIGDHRRARQNVILELGYFLGRLGRGKVRAIYKAGVELPSDLHGWLYTAMDEAGAWRFQLGRELRAAGFEVDLNRLA